MQSVSLSVQYIPDKGDGCLVALGEGREIAFQDMVAVAIIGVEYDDTVGARL